MYIKCLVENTTETELEAKHGLCFYVETANHKILFDLGPDELFYENALKSNIDISKVDTVVISHGHNDHGGGLKTFLEHNSIAKIYLQKNAFNDHFRKGLPNVYIGLDKTLQNNKQIILIDGDLKLDDELLIFTAKKHEFLSPMNKTLLNENLVPDLFEHEQSLLIKEDKNILLTGCSHSGVFNIIDSIDEKIDVQIGGFHLFNPSNKDHAPNEYLDEFIKKLNFYPNVFYTCHCTGEYSFNYLKKQCSKINYISCGMELIIK